MTHMLTNDAVIGCLTSARGASHLLLLRYVWHDYLPLS
jgi:hypothetical protein